MPVVNAKDMLSKCIVQKDAITLPDMKQTRFGVLAARGSPGQGIAFSKLKGDTILMGSVTSRASDADRGHTRCLLKRANIPQAIIEYFVVGCHWSRVEGEVDRYYVTGPMSENELSAPIQTWPDYRAAVDLALLESAGLVIMEEV